MQWLQVSVEVAAEVAEAVADVLSRYAPDGVAIEAQPPSETVAPMPVTVRAYLPMDGEMERVKARVEEALWHLGQISPVPAPTFATIAQEDWADAWKEHFHPLRVGQRIVIKPSWRTFESRPEDILIELDPGMAFGTGLHPTTQMCLVALEELVKPGMRVLDLGTGSGILAVAAARLGARNVLAIDNDPVAVEAARKNIERNGVSELVTVVEGSLAEANEAYDLVVVNILARIIIQLAQEGLADRVRPEGWWVAAGIIESQTKDVVATLENAGLTVKERQQIADWVTLSGQKSA